MSASYASGSHEASRTARNLKVAASLIVGIPAVLLGGLAGLVEESPMLLWLGLLAAVFVAIILIAWRWPVLGGALVAVFGLGLEYMWFSDQLGGSVQALIDSIGDVSPLWFTILALFAGALFAFAGVIERQTTR